MPATKNIKLLYGEIDDFIDRLSISEVEKDDFVSLLKTTIDAAKKEAFKEGFAEGQEQNRNDVKDAFENLQRAFEEFIDEI